MDQILERSLHEALAELFLEDIPTVVAFEQFWRDRHQSKERCKADAEISEVEYVQILSKLDVVAALSAVTGPPKSNRDSLPVRG